MSSSFINVLVVESEPMRARRIVSMLGSLEEQAFEVLHASNLLEGLRICSGKSIQLIVSALRLPDAKALDALVRFRSAARDAALIALLDDEEPEVILEAAQSLADDSLLWNNMDEASIAQSIRFALERRKMLRELRETQEQSSAAMQRAPYRGLLDQVDIGVCVLSSDAELCYANEVSRAWLGEKLQEEASRMLRSWQDVDAEAEIELETGNVSVPWVELRVASVSWRGEQASLLSLRNISKRKRAEEALLASQRRLKVALNASSIGLWSWDAQIGLFRIGERMKELLGYADNEFPDTLESLESYLHAEDAGKTLELLSRYFDDPWEDFEREYRMRHKDGSYRNMICRAEAVRDAAGKVTQIIGSHIDITESKKQEEARAMFDRQILEMQKWESLGSMAGSLAHNLNNILTSVLGHASELKRALDNDPKKLESIQNLEKSSQRASEICSKMLSFSGQGSLAEQKLDLCNVLEDSLALVGLALPEAVALDVENAVDALPIKADASEMQQLIVGLAMNAVEALQDTSEPKLRIRSEKFVLDHSKIAKLSNKLNAQPGEHAMLEVTDNGRGVSPELLEKIFDPFFSTKGHGRGLGLAAIKGIVQAHGGAIDFRSQIDCGTLCRVYLPLHGKPTPTTSSLDKGSESKRVLLAEDEDVLRMVIASMLTSFGYEPIVAKDGREALKLYREFREDWAMALLDVNMPFASGIEIFHIMRADGYELPVALMSGDDDEVSASFENVSRENCRFLFKPFGIEQLKQTMKELTQKPALAAT